MFHKEYSIRSYLSKKAKRIGAFLASPRSERGEEFASVAALTALVLLIILTVMGIFRTALVAAFDRIAAMLSF